MILRTLLLALLSTAAVAGPPPAVAVKFIGPYRVDYTQFASGDHLGPVPLFVPKGNELILGIVFDQNTSIAFDTGLGFGIGQNLVFDGMNNGWVNGGSGLTSDDDVNAGTTIFAAYSNTVYAAQKSIARVVGTDPVVFAFDPAGGPYPAPTRGHYDIYFLLTTLGAAP